MLDNAAVLQLFDPLDDSGNRHVHIFPNGRGIDWYSVKMYWPLILIIVYIWKNAGYTAIVYMAGIAGIDKEIFEAARIDGASKVKQIISITLPMLRPTVIIMTLMSGGMGTFAPIIQHSPGPCNPGGKIPIFRGPALAFSVINMIETSSAVVGSSAINNSGRVNSAIAIITRWRSPPES